MRLLLLMFIVLSSFVFANEHTFSVEEITQYSLGFSSDQGMMGTDFTIRYGKTPDLELGKVNGLTINGLHPATYYYIEILKGSTVVHQKRLYSTQSKSSGKITVYFTQPVDNSVSSMVDAVHVSAIEDTIVAYINNAEHTIDMANYNTGSLKIVQALNNATSRGVQVRYVAADNTGTNNGELNNLAVPMIVRPNDGEVMHNKFIVIDKDDVNEVQVITGSVNHTNNSMHNDYNNLVIIQDQTLAMAYTTEFEEMWGSTIATPNAANAKFGAAKIDNTPHNFNIGGVPVELYFSPSDGTTQKIVDVIDDSHKTVEFALLTYTNNDLGDAMEEAHVRGVSCKGIIENSWYFGSEYNRLQNTGIPVYSHSTTSPVLHHKYAVVDAFDFNSDPTVITGSHNWSNSAEDDYDENTLIIHDLAIAQMYLEDFYERYNDITGIDNYSKEPQVIVFMAGDLLNIRTSEKVENVSIIDASGKTIVSKNNFISKEISLQDVSEGMYVVEVYLGKEKIRKKIFVNK